MAICFRFHPSACETDDAAKVSAAELQPHHAASIQSTMDSGKSDNVRKNYRSRLRQFINFICQVYIPRLTRWTYCHSHSRRQELQEQILLPHWSPRSCLHWAWSWIHPCLCINQGQELHIFGRGPMKRELWGHTHTHLVAAGPGWLLEVRLKRMEVFRMSQGCLRRQHGTNSTVEGENLPQLEMQELMEGYMWIRCTEWMLWQKW